MKGGLSRKALLAGLSDGEGEVADTRPVEMERLSAVPEDVLEAVREVFVSAGLNDTDEAVAAVLVARREVTASWEAATRNFLSIGRTLNRLEAQIRGGNAQRALRAGCARIFPFGDAVASQLRAVARAVDGGVIKENECPGSYAAAYQLTLLDAEELSAARQKGLVGPGVTRPALLAFRRAITAAARPGAQIDLSALRSELRRVQVRLEALDVERGNLRRRREEIEALLSGDGE
ncbi:hypothetical protein [Muricoccus aerilatus]|uniref:hypothetical protein n=1 Tax=Muricoccus aerilatus TaxID=452982 RepID=UPI0012EC450C|nr:hypothetical protein [Roseomonas aerilata]